MSEDRDEDDGKGRVLYLLPKEYNSGSPDRWMAGTYDRLDCVYDACIDCRFWGMREFATLDEAVAYLKAIK